ncbi:MAG: tetratricopeptide repeat protein [Acidobacteriia bacterium]|nr:tetratricopeptide repeat protein [Terriglobia bacterium]
MSGVKSALIIANSQYEHTGLRQLTAPTQDAQALADVLADPTIGGFEVRTLVNQRCAEVMHEIEKFYRSRTRDDLLPLYFSGHGLKDEDGKLYLAALNTDPQWLRSTAIPDHFVNEVMAGSRSKRQVLLLDCCYSGAFAKALLAKGEANVVLKDHFEGRGRVLLTASDAVQYSFESGIFESAVESSGSVFTQTLVEGLRSGEADQDGDGVVSLDELYDFVHDRVLDVTPHQRPMKWELDVEGEIIIARNPAPFVNPSDLPQDIRDAIGSKFPSIREEAIHELERLLRGRHRGLALAARTALKTLTADDSRRVSDAAEKCLAANPAPAAPEEMILQSSPGAVAPPAQPKEEITTRPERKTQEEAERKAPPAAEPRRLETQKAEAVRLAPEKEESRTRCEQGVALFKKRDVEGAIAEYRAALRLDKDNAEAHNGLGDALFEKEDWDGAMAEFREALRLNPQFAEAQRNIGVVFDQKGELDEAMEEYRKALRLNPDSAEAHTAVANGLRVKGDLEGALAECREAIRLKPAYASAHNICGLVLSDKGDLDEALPSTPPPCI